jgi:hypothetical protein
MSDEAFLFVPGRRRMDLQQVTRWQQPAALKIHKEARESPRSATSRQHTGELFEMLGSRKGTLLHWAAHVRRESQ